MQNDEKKSQNWVNAVFPWIAGGAVFVLYLFMAQRWINYLNLEVLGKAAGWDWRPVFDRPLDWIIGMVVRILPGGWQILALNGLSAVMAFVTLVLLARSVSLLPHDRTRAQRQREQSDFSLLSTKAAWLPPLLAVLVCGLQRTFLEHATAYTGEMLGVLMFAYAIRCLLEHRVDQRQSWLFKVAFVYGLAIVNNYAMIGFLPLFVGALIWIKGMSIFEGRLLVRMGLCGLAGLSFYFLMPLVGSLSGNWDAGFWELMRLQLGAQKNGLFNSVPRFYAILLSVSSIVPVILIGIRWASNVGDTSRAGIALRSAMTHVLHLVFLGLCIYVAFDHKFSPRVMVGRAAPFLTFYYLGALSVGYFAGYFLLVFGSGRAASGRSSSIEKAGRLVLVAAVWLTLVAVPVALALRNVPGVHSANGPELHRLALRIGESIPTKAIVLTDDLLLSYAISSELAKSEKEADRLLVETGSLPNPYYHRYLHRKQPQLWPALVPEMDMKTVIGPSQLIPLMMAVSQTNELFYAHPSFGYYFERFYLEPHGQVYQMRLLSATNFLVPPIPPAALEETTRAWDKLKKEDFPRLLAQTGNWTNRPPNFNTIQVAGFYSRGLNNWGVELQKLGKLVDAGECFQIASKLHPGNLSAVMNAEFNRHLQSGSSKSFAFQTNLLGRLGNRFEAILGLNGAIDEPSIYMSSWKEFAGGRNFTQAAQQLRRRLDFQPENFDDWLWVARLLIQAQRANEGIAHLNEIQGRFGDGALSPANLMDMGIAEAWGEFARGNLGKAEQLLAAAQTKFNTQAAPFAALAEIYLNIVENYRRDAKVEESKAWSIKAADMLAKQLERQPDNVDALFKLGVMMIRLDDCEKAVTNLDRVVMLDPKNMLGYLNRAIANLKLNRLDEAQRDYEMLSRNLPELQKQNLPQPPFYIYYGLGEIAYRKAQKSDAIKHYETYLGLAPRENDEVKAVRDRLKTLKAG